MSKSCPYRWFLVKTRISEKLSDCLVFCRNILTNKQLTTLRLSANCLDGLLMKRELSDEKNCQMKRIIRWKEFRRQEMYALAESWKQEYGYYNINFWAFVWQQICPTGASTLPMMGKHVTPVGQARCPSGVSTLPNMGKHVAPLGHKFHQERAHWVMNTERWFPQWLKANKRTNRKTKWQKRKCPSTCKSC